jgi:pimeloyl-ACP methyl ester carboxylesterase
MMGVMTRFASYDGTEIGYRVLGGTSASRRSLICLPGGPGREGVYLENLGGLDQTRRLIIPDTRGTGLSGDPANPATFRVDRLVNDVEALRVHLDLNQIDLLAHSAAANLGLLYAAGYPERLSNLLLITPGVHVLGLDLGDEPVTAALTRRRDEPWYPEASAALDKIRAGDRTPDAYRATRPFYYGRWTDRARDHSTLGTNERNAAARDGFFAGYPDSDAFDPAATRAALSKLAARVLLYAGALDPFPTPGEVRETAKVFPDATVTIQAGAGHFPWVDDPDAFAAAIGSFVG